MADSMDIDGLRRARGWSQARLARELRSAAERQGATVPGDETLIRQIRFWANDIRQPSGFYLDLLTRAFGLPVERELEAPDAFAQALLGADSLLDEDLVTSLENHTQSLRLLDRRIGAQRLLDQVEAHTRTISDFVQWAPFGKSRSQLARAGAEAAALAGWQALDLGRLKHSWQLHRQARSLAKESEDLSVIAHVTAQQAYALMDAGRLDRAVAQVEAARTAAGRRVPRVVQAWLCAAEAETRSAAGDRTKALRLLDQADHHASSADELPYIVLGAGHLARWRGHCLAQLADPDAEPTLTSALRVLKPEFTRAAAAVHVDLALTHSANGDPETAQQHAREAARLSASSGSVRQQTRISPLLNAEGQ